MFHKKKMKNLTIIKCIYTNIDLSVTNHYGLYHIVRQNVSQKNENLPIIKCKQILTSVFYGQCFTKNIKCIYTNIDLSVTNHCGLYHIPIIKCTNIDLSVYTDKMYHKRNDLSVTNHYGTITLPYVRQNVSKMYLYKY